MNSSQRSAPSSSQKYSLLPDFLSIDQIQCLPSIALKEGKKVNVFGFLKDFQPPTETKGSDFKCTFEILDFSVPYGSPGIKINIFWPRENMPQFHSAGDAVLVRGIKAQMWAGVPSLLAHKTTEIHVLPASKIPISPSGSSNSWRSFSPKQVKRPTVSETIYVIEIYRHVAELALPTTTEFEEKSYKAMNVKDKFALLKDVKNQCFYNILGEVIKVHDHESFDRVTVYLTDYTANSEFYNYAGGDGENSTGRDGDEHNYLKSRKKNIKAWPGPHGKMSIQISLYDGHASFVKEQVKAGQWILLSNVQIKYGNMGGCLEGFLRGDREALEGKVQVEILEKSREPEGNDYRWKEAIARKLKWETKFKHEKQDLLDEAAGKKRKREDEPPKKNSKARRKERRAALEGKSAATKQKLQAKLDLNENIRCTNSDQATAPLATILQPRNIRGPKESGKEYTSPFDVCKYKANVRVIGYFPHKIEDFVVGHRPSDYDVLSDYSGGEDTDPEEDMRAYRSGKGFPEKEWEWRFALQVVDANDKTASKERAWLIVGNYDAQMLLNMDATNLRKDKEALQQVKEQLCILWGDLEEQKSALADAKKSKQKSPSSSYIIGDQPPLDSDNEQENTERNRSHSKSFQSATALRDRDPNVWSAAPEDTSPDRKPSTQLQFKNKGFTCCIKQYGVKVDEANLALANAGDGKRWERKFGLFGTKIV